MRKGDGRLRKKDIKEKKNRDWVGCNPLMERQQCLPGPTVIIYAK